MKKHLQFRMSVSTPRKLSATEVKHLLKIPAGEKLKSLSMRGGGGFFRPPPYVFQVCSTLCFCWFL